MCNIYRNTIIFKSVTGKQKSKSALVRQNQKKIFFEFSPYIVYSKIRMLTFLTEDCSDG